MTSLLIEFSIQIRMTIGFTKSFLPNGKSVVGKVIRNLPDTSFSSLRDQCPTSRRYCCYCRCCRCCWHGSTGEPGTSAYFQGERISWFVCAQTKGQGILFLLTALLEGSYRTRYRNSIPSSLNDKETPLRVISKKSTSSVHHGYVEFIICVHVRLVFSWFILE